MSFEKIIAVIFIIVLLGGLYGYVTITKGDRDADRL
jgi:hypothetical protein